MRLAYWTGMVLLAVSGCLVADQDGGGFDFGEGTNAGSGEASTSPTTLTTGIDPTSGPTSAGSSSSESTSVEPTSDSSESSGVPPPECGDGEVESPETCDGGVPTGATCASEGMTDGTLACDVTTCTLDLSGCWLCGDDEAEGEESCDGDDLDGATCESLGFGGGALACAADCTFDTSPCTPLSFLEDWETGAMSGDWVLGGDGNWQLAGGTPIAGTWSARSGDIGPNGETSLGIDLTFPSGGTISFTHRESTEADFDALHFFIDGVQQDEWSGAHGAASASYDVAAGTHTFEWRYAKDNTINAGLDAVWVDDIEAEGGSPR